MQNNFNDLVITDEPITGGVIMRRYPDGIETNIPHLVTHHSPSGYEWGYAGSGPADLALNILEAALLEMGYNGQRVECRHGSCFTLAWKLHHNFKREFIEGLPIEGGLIYWQALRGWILDNQAEQP